MMCECDKGNFHGMPDFSFALAVDSYQTKFYYSMTPEDYEMAPVSKASSRFIGCYLGFWNLYSTTKIPGNSD